MVELAPFTATITWTPSTVKSAETLADAGNFVMCADLAEWISSKDLRVASALTTRIKAPMVLDWHDDAKEIGKIWNNICPFEEEVSIKRDMLMQGFCLVETVPTRIMGVTYPRLYRQNARFLRYDKMNDKWFFRTAKGEIELNIGGGRWSILSTESRERPWVYGLYRSLSRWVLLTQYALDDCGNYSNRHGTGIFVLNSAEGDRRKATVESLRSMGRNGVIGLVGEDKLALLEAQAKTYEVFFEQMKIAQQEISIGIVGANLGMQASAGTGQVASVHMEATTMRWAIDNKAFGSCVHSQILAPFGARFGYEYQVPLRDMDDIEDDRIEAAARQSNSQALVGAIGAGVKISQAEARELMLLEPTGDETTIETTSETSANGTQ
jgi:phage gp29-like protein